MKKWKKCFILLLAMCLVLSTSVAAQAASYYSVRDIGLDYKKGSYGMFGAGKNGYSLVYIESIKGNTVSYRNYKFYFSPYLGMSGKKYGKVKRAKLTKKTKYFLGNPRRYVSLAVKAAEKGNQISGIHSKSFKNMKWIQKVNRRTFTKKQTKAFTYIKVKKGKVDKVVSRLQIGN